MSVWGAAEWFSAQSNEITSKVPLTLNFQDSVLRNKDLESNWTSLLKHSMGSDFSIFYSSESIVLIFFFKFSFSDNLKNLSELDVLLSLESLKNIL